MPQTNRTTPCRDRTYHSCWHRHDLDRRSFGHGHGSGRDADGKRRAGIRLCLKPIGQHRVEIGLTTAVGIGTTSIGAALGTVTAPVATLTASAAPEYAYASNQSDNTVSRSDLPQLLASARPRSAQLWARSRLRSRR